MSQAGSDFGDICRNGDRNRPIGFRGTLHLINVDVSLPILLED
jgi:hypothetical protein